MTETAKRVTRRRWTAQRVLLWLVRGRGGPQRLGELLTVGSSLATAVVALVAGAKYVFGAFSPIDLEIELPPVIEFRCSDSEFDAQRCTQGPDPSLYNTTISAALNLRAVGDITQEAMIMSALATLRTGPDAKDSYTLTWLYGADQGAGQPFQRTQVTINSLKGGEARSQEMWFFPVEEPCGSRTRQQCEETNRRNFLTWTQFLSKIQTTPDGPLDKSAYTVDFSFKYREGDDNRVKVRKIVCAVELSSTVMRMTNSENFKGKGVLGFSVPCRPQAGKV